jgi:hypothetical protein
MRTNAGNGVYHDMPSQRNKKRKSPILVSKPGPNLFYKNAKMKETFSKEMLSLKTKEGGKARSWIRYRSKVE